MTTQDLTLDWDDFKAVFKPEPEPDMTFTDDPVALACGAYRMYLSNPALRWADFTDVEVTAEDRSKAQEIRSYYTGRILMDAMKSKNPMSEFRKKLYGLLIGETGLKKKDIGLLYRLPYFYAEDTAMDQVMAQTETVTGPSSREVSGHFRVIKRISVSRRSGETVQLWLQNDSNKVPFMIASKLDNPFLSLTESILRQPIKLSATAYKKQHRGHYRNRLYYQLGNLEIV